METGFGEICQKCSAFEWKIEDFTGLSDKSCNGYQSPTFKCFETDWSIDFYVDGKNSSCKGCISLYLHNMLPNKSCTVDFNCSLKHDDKILKTCNATCEFKEDVRSCGWIMFLQRSEILNKIKLSSPRVSTVTIILEMRSCTPEYKLKESLSQESVSIHVVKSNVVPGETLVHNLKDLYMNKKNCDFTITVKDRAFPTHKVILAARSPVFAANFAHNGVENQPKTMTVDEFEPDVFNDFLLYLYTLETKTLSSKNVFELYQISDKYDVKDLKHECLAFMRNNLNLENVSDTLLLAEKYTETELLIIAKNFVAQFASHILSSSEWEKLAGKNVLLAHKILKMIVLDNAWRIK